VPLHYPFSHPHRLVIAVAKGSLLAEEVVAFIAKIDAENDQSYRKIFDMIDLQTVFASDRVQRLADVVRARAATGPIAIVAGGERVRHQARLFRQWPATRGLFESLMSSTCRGSGLMAWRSKELGGARLGCLGSAPAAPAVKPAPPEAGLP
jgi:hypothetical protein